MTGQSKSDRRLLPLALVAAGLLLAVALIYAMDQDGLSPVGKPAADSIRVFLPAEELSGETFVILSDTHCDECNERRSELNNLIVKLGKAGSQIRMLHASKHAFPARSYQDSVDFNRGAPNHIITADRDVLYADPAIRKLKKPCLVRLVDGNVAETRVGDDFDQWVKEN